MLYHNYRWMAFGVRKHNRPLRFSKVKMVLSGGEDRLSSVQNGVSAVDKKSTHIAVHDGARPLVSTNVIASAIRKAEKFGAAAPAIPVKDTVKEKLKK